MDLLFRERRKLGSPISFFAGPFFANVFSPVPRVFFLAANGSIWLRGTLANRPRSFILRKCQQRSRKIAFKSERRHTSFLPVWRFRTCNLAEYEKILSDYTILSDFRLTYVISFSGVLSMKSCVKLRVNVKSFDGLSFFPSRRRPSASSAWPSPAAASTRAAPPRLPAAPAATATAGGAPAARPAAARRPGTTPPPSSPPPRPPPTRSPTSTCTSPSSSSSLES